MKKSIFLLALLLLSYSLSYSQDTLWIHGYDIHGDIRRAIFSPDDSKILVTGTETFFEVNPQNGEMIREMPEFTKSGIWDVDVESNLGITSDGKLVNLSDYSLFNDFVKYLKSKYSPTQGYSYNKDFTRTVVKFNGKDSDTFDTLRIINARTNEEISEIYLEQSVQSLGEVQISPDGRYLALFHFYYGIKEIDGKIYEGDDHIILRLFDVSSKQEIKKMTFPATQQTISLKFSPDGSMLAMKKGGIDMYTVPDLDFIDNFRLVPGGGGINSYEFTRDSKSIIMCSGIDPMQKFSIKDNSLLKTFIFHYSLQRFSINQNDDRILAVSGNGLLLYSDIPTTITNDGYIETIYPNPGTEGLILKLPIFQIGNFKILILDSNGKRVFTEDYTMTNDSVSIDISSYPRGIYFINVEQKNSLRTYKFIKE